MTYSIELYREHRNAALSIPFGERLANARRDRGLTQDQLGKETGYSQSIISRKERGSLDLTPCDAANLAKALLWPSLLTHYCRDCPATRTYQKMQRKEAG